MFQIFSSKTVTSDRGVSLYREKTAQNNTQRHKDGTHKHKRDFKRPMPLLFSLGRWPLSQSVNTVAKRKGIHSLASFQRCDFLSAHVVHVCVWRHLVILWEMFSLVRLVKAVHRWRLNNEKLKSCGRVLEFKLCCLRDFLAILESQHVLNDIL